MATTSGVMVGLDRVAANIEEYRGRFEKAKANIQAWGALVGAIPTKEADLISTVQGYTGADPFEIQAESKRNRLTTDFLALKAEMDALIAEF